MKAFFAAMIVLGSLGMGTMATTANANPLTLSPVNGNLFQQTAQRPCIFANPSCSNGGFPATDLPMGGNVSTYDLLSPVYTGAALNSILAGGALRVGLDVIEANGQPPETLSLFTMLKNGVVVDTFSFAGSGNVPAVNDGNGFADYILTGFSSFNPNDTLQFHFVFNNATSSPEDLFLIPGSPIAAPEPSSLVTMAFGLLLTGVAYKKRRFARK